VTVVGPERLTMERTCVAGRTCSLDGITGTHLMATDSFVVLDTCGTIGTVDAFPSGGIVTGVTRSGASVSWGNVPVTATGGRYRVCWCAGGFGCNTGLGYFAEVGFLNVVGPTALIQERTCIAGQTCSFDGILGADLGTSDLVYALDTCGQSGGAGLISKLPAAGLIASNVGTGASLSWGVTQLTGSGGVYRLCWCSSPVPGRCSQVEDFKSTVGQLTLIGPLLGGTRTCVSGQTCSLDDIYGTHLSSGDSFAILDTCGVDAVQLIPGGALGTTTSAGSTESGVSWATLTSSGGHYRLCWCASGMTCSLARTSGSRSLP
jgi:hypothetical protein